MKKIYILVSICIISFILLTNNVFYENILLEKLYFEPPLYSIPFSDNQVDSFDENDFSLEGSLVSIRLKSDFNIEHERNKAYINNSLYSNVNYDKLLQDLRQKSKDYYTKIRTSFFENHDFLLRESTNQSFSSPYIFHVTTDIIRSVKDFDDHFLKVLKNNSVESVHISQMYKYSINLLTDPIECVTFSCSTGTLPPIFPDDPDYDFSNVLRAINATNVLQEYTGNGINIGIYEAQDPLITYPNGFINRFNAAFANRTVNYYQYDGNDSIHPTYVASVALGNNGIAKEAGIYSAQTISNNVIDLLNESPLQWFLEQNVHVINMSFGFYYDTVGQTPYLAVRDFFDKFISDNLVLMVAATGNVNTKYVAAPAIANNVVAVGGTNISGNRIYSNSTYLTPYSIGKPNIVAPAEMNVPDRYGSQSPRNNYNKGTSYAAPLVTGAIALALEANPQLILFPEIMISLLASSANIGVFPLSYNNFYSGYEDRIGAGLLDIGNLIQSVHNYSSIILFDNQTDSYSIYNNYILLEDNIPIDIYVTSFWFAKVINDVHVVNNFGLELYLNGVLIASSHSIGNNSKLIRYSVQESGELHIKITLNENITFALPQFIAVTWSFV